MSKELKKILKTMSALKEHCEQQNGCEDCPFCIVENNLVYGEKYRYCQLKELAHELSHMPCAWDIDEIADIMNR